MTEVINGPSTPQRCALCTQQQLHGASLCSDCADMLGRLHQIRSYAAGFGATKSPEMVRLQLVVGAHKLSGEYVKLAAKAHAVSAQPDTSFNVEDFTT